MSNVSQILLLTPLLAVLAVFLMGPKKGVCPSDAATATFHSVQNEARSFHVSQQRTAMLL